MPVLWRAYNTSHQSSLRHLSAHAESRIRAGGALVTRRSGRRQRVVLALAPMSALTLLGAACGSTTHKAAAPASTATTLPQVTQPPTTTAPVTVPPTTLPPTTNTVRPHDSYKLARHPDRRNLVVHGQRVQLHRRRQSDRLEHIQQQWDTGAARWTVVGNAGDRA